MYKLSIKVATLSDASLVEQALLGAGIPFAISNIVVEVEDVVKDTAKYKSSPIKMDVDTAARVETYLQENPGASMRQVKEELGLPNSINSIGKIRSGGYYNEDGSPKL